MVSEYDCLILSGRDLRKIIKLKNEYKETRDNSLHEKAEKIRAKYGYSGGIDGSMYISLKKNY